MFKNLKLSPALENIAVIFTLILANRRSLVFQDFYLKIPFRAGHLWVELAFWFVLSAWVIWTLTKKRMWLDFINSWRNNWFLIPFLTLAALSILWTIHFQASLYRVLVLILGTFIAAFIGFYFGIRRFLVLLLWTGGILIFFSYLIILLFPSIGTMLGHPYYGAWRGIFWHRNQLSTIMAFIAVLFFMQVIQNWKGGGWRVIIWGFLWLTTIPLVVLSRSLTGIGLFIGLQMLAILFFLWRKLRLKLDSRQLGVLTVSLLLILLVGLTQFGRLTSLVNKSGSWFGRVALWRELFSTLVWERPLLGYGYGAIWNFHDFRVNLGNQVGWSMPILIGDNGYVDILLHLGFIGLILFIFVLGAAGFRYLKDGISGENFDGLIPFLLVIFLLISNISFSLFMEVEIFYWIVMVSFLFIRKKTIINSTMSI